MNIIKFLQSKKNVMLDDQIIAQCVKLFESGENLETVYFFRNGPEGKNVQIGSALDLKRRAFELQKTLDKPLFLDGYIISEQKMDLLSVIKSSFSKSKKYGDWFELSKKDTFICIKTMYGDTFFDTFDKEINYGVLSFSNSPADQFLNKNVCNFVDQNLNKKLFLEDYSHILERENISVKSFYGLVKEYVYSRGYELERLRNPRRGLLIKGSL